MSDDNTEELILVRGCFNIPINSAEREKYLEEVKASQAAEEEEEPITASALSIHIGGDLQTVIAATRQARPELTFEESWNLLRHQRPDLFPAAGFDKTEIVQAVVNPRAGKPDLKELVCSVMRDHQGWTFAQSWTYAEKIGLFAVRA
jgi:hypothetical protein